MLYVKLFSLGLACGHTSYFVGPILKYSGVDYYGVATIFKSVKNNYFNIGESALFQA